MGGSKVASGMVPGQRDKSDKNHFLWGTVRVKFKKVT